MIKASHRWIVLQDAMPQAYSADRLQASLKLRKGSAVYHVLKSAILLYQKKPGTPLVEQALAGEFGCSQGTVREALLRLQEEGLVVRAGYRGSFVSDISAAEAAEMVAIRIRIETQGARRAATRIDTTDRARLAEIIERMERAAQSGDCYACSDLDRIFHLTVFRLSGLDALEPILNRCALNMHRYTVGADACRSSASLAKTARQHWMVLDALASADPDQAAQAVRQHIEAVVDLASPVLHQAVAAANEGKL